MSALKKYSPATRIIGYQHTVVPQASANMFLSEHDADIAPLPDRILTVGAIPKKIIERYGFYKNIPVEEACALRFEYLESLPVGPRAKKRKILLGLEGVQKVYKLVNYVLQECENVKDLEIVIRDHPVLPFRNLQRDVKYDIDNMANVSLSKNLSVKDDVESADIVIYWGSSVALEASMMGKPVIHFDSGTVLSYDPLFENTALKWTVTEKDRLLDIIDSIYALSDEEFCLQQQKARQYLRNYFYPVTENGLQKFVN